MWATIIIVPACGGYSTSCEIVEILNPNLTLQTTGGGYGMQMGALASVSGLNDYDYQNLSTLSMGMKQLNQLVTTNKVPIPPEIMDHFKRM